MNIDLNKIFQDACSVSLLELTESIKKRFVEFFGVRSRLYFFDKRDIQRYKDNPSLCRVAGIDINDPDVGMVQRMIEDALTEKIMNEDMTKFMREYMDKNFDKHLVEAMDRAMQHKANAMAFKAVKERNETAQS